jgi:organic radical activating enzyme
MELANPVGADEACMHTLELDRPPGIIRAVSITGGEPLEQPGFVEAIAQGLKARIPVLLETNGIHHDAMRGLLGLIDIVSVDIKLPSTTGLDPLWDKHEAFLEILDGPEVSVKVVVGPDTPDDEVATAARLTVRCASHASFTIQPMTGRDGLSSVPGGRLLGMYLAASAEHKDVRVIPQSHKTLGVM